MKSYEFIIENDSEHRAELNRTGFWGKQGAGCIILAKDTGRICLPHRSQYVEQPGTWGTWGGAIDKHSMWILEHESGGKLYLWSPAPAVADVAMEEFVKDWHKCTDIFHVVVVPRLLTPQWRHLFNM